MFPHSPLGGLWRFRQGRDVQMVRVTGSLRADNGHTLVNAAVEGLGLVFEPEFLVSGHVSAQQFVPVPPDWDTDEISVHAGWPTRKFLPAKVRSFVDFLVERIGE